MSPEINNEAAEPISAPVTTVEKAPLTVDMTEAGTLSKLPSSQTALSEQDWQQLRTRLSWLLTEFPERMGEVFGEYKQPITTAAIVLAAIPFVAFAAAILEVINAIPLFAPTFELIGFGFTSWFIYRYLLFADRRQEFTQSLEALKQEILGESSDSGESH
uniref:Cyanobacterial aminoacyl-tRNA synthetase CAAD domain-containing protein n=1 Tax=Cyanothece sp. (strain PCC 7425 / ATCC 29141) TaxID=395961 RepID=B8HQN7_CYAP4